MTRQSKIIITTLFILFACLTDSFGQSTANDIFEKAQGTLSVPLNFYKTLEDIQMRKEASKPCYRYDQTDSSLTFVTDSTYEVRAVYDGVVKVLFNLDNSYSFGTKFGDYFILYSGLTKPYFNLNDTVRCGQTIGRLYKGKGDIACELWFSVQKVDKSLNTCKWLKQ